MTNETQQTATPDHKVNSFGARLKSARESIGLDRKDAAAQLRLSEKIIAMLEKERFPDDLPITFVRGYIRSYGKLLQIPELEIAHALEPIKQKNSEPDPLTLAKTPATLTSGNYFMQLSTYLIILTLVSLLAAWWYSHTSTRAPATDNKLIALPENPAPAANNVTPPLAPPTTLSTPATPTTAAQPQNNAAPTTAAPTPTDAQKPMNQPKPAAATKQPPAQEEDSADDDDYDAATDGNNN